VASGRAAAGAPDRSGRPRRDRRGRALWPLGHAGTVSRPYGRQRSRTDLPRHLSPSAVLRAGDPTASEAVRAALIEDLRRARARLDGTAQPAPQPG
jgi:hypothetical protein